MPEESHSLCDLSLSWIRSTLEKFRFRHHVSIRSIFSLSGLVLLRPSTNPLVAQDDELLFSNSSPQRGQFISKSKCKVALTLAEGTTHVAHWKNFCKIAFTLAEVLITLGIIGVVAAITLPSVLTNIQNKDLQAQFKKSYSEWNQVAMQFMVDHDQSIPDYTSEYGVGALINELPKYVKGFRKFSNWTFEDKDENGSAVTTTPYPIYALKGYRVATMCDISGYYNDISGRFISFEDKPQKGFNGPRLCFDLNGDKKPNKIGLDIFYFQFTTDGHIISEGTEHPNNNYELDSAMSGTVKAEPKYCNGDAFEYAITCAYYA